MDEQMPPLPKPTWVMPERLAGERDWNVPGAFTAEQMHAYAKEYAAALSQPAAADEVKDAGRYRFLRDMKFDPASECGEGICIDRWAHCSGEQLCGVAADQAIDDAMTAPKATP